MPFPLLDHEFLESGARQLHSAINPDSGEILASELMTNAVGDLAMIDPLLDQIQSPISLVMADGAYDAEPVYRAVVKRQPPPALIVPPRVTAVLSPAADTRPSPRDWHIQMIQEKGRRGWQKTVGHGRRALVETAMFRYKTLIGRRCVLALWQLRRPKPASLVV